MSETGKKSLPGSITVHDPDRPINPTTCDTVTGFKNFCQHDADHPHLPESEVMFFLRVVHSLRIRQGSKIKYAKRVQLPIL